MSSENIELEKAPQCNEKVRKLMLALARQIPLEKRVKMYEYPFIHFGSNEYPTQKPTITKQKIEEFDTDYLKKILKMTGHSIEGNTDIILHTIYEELNKRRKHEAISNNLDIVLLC